MKAGLLFFLVVVGVIVVLALLSDPARVELKDGKLRFFNKKCEYGVEVQIVKEERDSVAELWIERKILRLPNGDSIVYETASLPPKYAFEKPYDHIVEEIFSMKVRELFSTDGFVLYQGEFAVALFYKTRSDLVLLYPADDLKEALIACFTKGEKRPLQKFALPIRKSRWDIKQIIFGELINKDI
ncbi:MAG: hypothetical protein GXO16_04260 [Epsilonproteobacteria bacterium]|nr:hypothetical protein [Campylobacterota bacterium]